MKTVVLTGVNRGLGKALSKELCSELFTKDKNIFISRRRSPDIISNKYTENLYIDLSKEDINFEQINLNLRSDKVIFINNASVIEPISKVLDMSLGNIDISMNVNFKSPLKLAQYLTRETKKIGIDFLIINITTGASARPIQGWLAYCTSKAAIKIALEVLMLENSHVKVIHFDPGVMDTDMQASIRSSSKEQMPSVELFKSFKKNSELKSTTDIAKTICNLIKESLL
jgi:benzil reductase ((S)-benzoin forming)